MQKSTLIVYLLILNFILIAYIIFLNSESSNRCQTIPDVQCEESPYCRKFDQRQRLASGDLSASLRSIGQYQDDIYEWDFCHTKNQLTTMNTSSSVSQLGPLYMPVQYCPFSPRIEQAYQLQFYDETPVSRWPSFTTCALLPPKNYQWPNKHIKYPITAGESPISWSNLGLNSHHDVVMFNTMYPKNAAHFDSAAYDIEQESYINLASQYIPFGAKVRTLLEIGGGTGSISFSLNKRYDISVLNTVRPEFPYCEFITERGGLCILLDSNKPLPFAKFSFDVVHHSWVYHGSTAAQWRSVLLEQNRILRPGGYLWIRDGLSYGLLKTIKYLMLDQLGYKVLYQIERVKPGPVTTFFGSNPFELEWTAILIKPNRLKNDRHSCD